MVELKLVRDDPGRAQVQARMAQPAEEVTPAGGEEDSVELPGAIDTVRAAKVSGPASAT